MNILAERGVRAIQGEMRRVFDRPTPYALNSLAWVEDLPGPAAAVVWRGSTDPWSRAGQFKGAHEGAYQGYLRAQIGGGPRRQKAGERRLQMRMPGGQTVYLVPTQFAQVDAYGNVTGPRMNKILSDLQALGGAGQGFDGNRRPGKRSRGRRRAEYYFVVWPGQAVRRTPGGRLLPNNLPPAIYQKLDVKGAEVIRPILIFAKKPPVYRQRLDPKAIVAGVVAREMPDVWADRLSKAIRRSA
ncbi:hypothetical protein GXW78_07530 [Roseomonas terrae]|uniref:Uncharacterized protein n=1 Tax=Neoroseomonas terrae TaxID=424799 RepID=A0ABS5EEW3_9PROT|nr:hypothetical protein [Neoroseomonas terrae]MBR0649505.1 hypothetical protein [Neoroseomonas terrae]